MAYSSSRLRALGDIVGLLNTPNILKKPFCADDGRIRKPYLLKELGVERLKSGRIVCLRGRLAFENINGGFDGLMLIREVGVEFELHRQILSGTTDKHR